MPKETPEVIQIPKEEWQKVQGQLKMLYEVADKGRVQSYEQQHLEKRVSRAKLSIYKDKYVVGWQVIEDSAIYHPTTGKQVGEKQEIEITLLDKDGMETKEVVNGYPRFTDIRYGKRVECEIVAKKETSDGNWVFDLKLPDDRVISLDQRFIN
jgi:hypothetical protein